MAEFETIQERNISGKGLLRVPSDFTKSRLLILYCSVYREPKNKYANFNYSPAQSQYGWLTFSRNGYVIGESQVKYPMQSFDGVTDITSQTLIAVKCAYDGLLQSFINLTNALSFTPGGIGLAYISVTDLIKDYEYLNLSWDEVRVVCYADTALNLKLVALPHDTCTSDRDRPRKPPVPPPPPDTVPPGEPVTNLDPPYEDEDNPDNFTEPYDGDSEPPLFGDSCSRYSVPFSLTYFDGIGNVFIETEAIVFGQIGTYRATETSPGNWDLLLECQGQAGSPGDTCQSFGEYSIFNGGSNYTGITVGEPVLIP